MVWLALDCHCDAEIADIVLCNCQLILHFLKKGGVRRLNAVCVCMCAWVMTGLLVMAEVLGNACRYYD